MIGLSRVCPRGRIPVFYFAALAAATLFSGGKIAGYTFEADLHLAHSFDDNVFQTGAGSLADQSSWITRVEPRLRWRMEDGTQLTYRLEALRFWDAGSEDHMRHHLGLRTEGSAGDWSYRFSTTHLQVMGPADAPVFDEGRSAFSTGAARERRNQWQNRTQGDLRWDLGEQQFLRLRGSLLYYDLNSTVRILPGYDNWIDRYDINAAIDWGTQLRDGLQAHIGVQRGYQHQGRRGGRISDRSNHYHRLLFGLSGQLMENLRVNIEAGPSHHDYRMGPGPLSTTRWFGNLGANWQMTERDVLSAAVSKRRFVASTGNLANTISSYSVAWRRQHSPVLSWNLGGQVRSIEYDGVNIGDWLYVGSVGVAYSFESGIRLGLEWERTLGRDRRQSVPGREYNGNVFTLTADYRF